VYTPSLSQVVKGAVIGDHIEPGCERAAYICVPAKNSEITVNTMEDYFVKQVLPFIVYQVSHGVWRDQVQGRAGEKIEFSKGLFRITVETIQKRRPDQLLVVNSHTSQRRR
jgi:hypothetical protein